MKIFLTGFPGSGKTFLGREVAALMKYPFYDTDKTIEEEEGKSITALFDEKGEEYFREVEARRLRDFGKIKKAVIATGGGLPCFHDNMEWMNEHGLTVYLQASDAFLFHRLIHDKKSRPLIRSLSDVELMEYITGTLFQRKAYYGKARIIVNAENMTPVKLLRKLEKQEKG